LDNNLEQRENFKAAFDHFDYKKMRNILMIKSLIYCKMLVSYATNLKFIRQLPTQALKSKNLEVFKYIWADVKPISKQPKLKRSSCYYTNF
jgi:hypothetical protein